MPYSQLSWSSSCGSLSSTCAVSQSSCFANCCADIRRTEAVANANHYYFLNHRGADVCPPGHRPTQAVRDDDILITRHTETSSESTWTEDVKMHLDENNTGQLRAGAGSTASVDSGRHFSNLQLHLCTVSLKPSSHGCRPLPARQRSLNILITAPYQQEVLNHAPNDVLIRHHHTHTTLAHNHHHTQTPDTIRRLLTTDDCYRNDEKECLKLVSVKDSSHDCLCSREMYIPRFTSCDVIKMHVCSLAKGIIMPVPPSCPLIPANQINQNA
jgi:hypothetical protein